MESLGIGCGGLFGLGILWWGIREFLNGRAAVTWPTTEGVIVESRIEKDCSGVDARYEPVVKYRYQVEDVEFTGERLRLGGINRFGSLSAAERHASPIPTGTFFTHRRR